MQFILSSLIGSCNSTRNLFCQLLKTFVSSFVAEKATVLSKHPDLIVPGELQSRQHLNSILPANCTICLTKSKQHDIQVIIDSSLQSQIKASASLRDKARLNTISASFAGSWIRAIPNSVFGLTMSAQEYIVCLYLWLGICLFPFPLSSGRCYCGFILDSHGHHVLGCHSGSLGNKRHNALWDILYYVVSGRTTQELDVNNDALVRINQDQETSFTLILCKVVPHILISLSEILFNHLILSFPPTQLVLQQQQGRWKKIIAIF